MINESALLESKSLRGSVLERTDVLDRVKALSLLPDGMHVTTSMVAAYFDATIDVIRQLAKRHREELDVNGMAVLRGADLRKFESDNMSLSLGSYPQARRSLTIYDRGIDITARTTDGRTIAVQCKNRAGRWSVPSADMQKFAGAARAIGRMDIPLFVATSTFSSEAQVIADLTGVITVNRDELEEWSAGVRLKALR